MACLRNSTVYSLNLCSNAPLNVAFGGGALANNSAGYGCNTGIGFAAQYSNQLGTSNTAIGYRARQYGSGDGHTAVGASAGLNMENSLGVAIGRYADNCSAGCTVSVGFQAGRCCNLGRAINIGAYAGYTCSGYENVHIGFKTGIYSASSLVTTFGAYAGGGTFPVGTQIGEHTILGGFRAGQYLGGAYNNILIGNSTSQYYGYGANHQVVLGNSFNNSYNCVYTGWTTVSDCRDKTNIQPISNLGLNFIRKLNPVKYKWDLRDKYVKECGFEFGIKDGTLKQDKVNYGFLAQEIEFAAKSLGENFDTITHDTFTDRYTLDYLSLLASLTRALQEINDDLDLIETQLNS